MCEAELSFNPWGEVFYSSSQCTSAQLNNPFISKVKWVASITQGYWELLYSQFSINPVLLREKIFVVKISKNICVASCNAIIFRTSSSSMGRRHTTLTGYFY